MPKKKETEDEKKRIQEFFVIPKDSFDPQQYLGDYYLHLGYFEEAFRQLKNTVLRLADMYGIDNGKTWNSLSRLYVAAFCMKDNKILDALDEYLLANTMSNGHAGKGIERKYEELVRLKDMRTRYVNNEVSQKQCQDRMFRIIDHKDGNRFA